MTGEAGADPTAQLRSALAAYLDAVERALQAFERALGRRDIIRACIEKGLPRRGSLAGVGDYQLHGIGCRVEHDGVEVDFDFGPGGRSDGFDSWRLGQFTEQFPDRYPDLQDKASLRAAFDTLERNGEIARLHHDSNLHFFRSAPAYTDSKERKA